MKHDDLSEKIVVQYYHDVYRYCVSKLGKDEQGAEDCTQEVFLLFLQKKDELDLNGYIKSWLFRAADLIIARYLCLQFKHSHIALEDVTIPCDGGLSSLLEITPMDQIREYLSEDELEFLVDYYSADYGKRNVVAKKYKLSISKIYHKIEAIKKKILG